MPVRFTNPDSEDLDTDLGNMDEGGKADEVVVDDKEEVVETGPARGEDGRYKTREEIYSEAGEDAEVEQTIEQLAASKKELTIDDLRLLPGTEDMTDQQLMAEWQKAQAAVADKTVQDEFKLTIPVYDEKGNKHENISKFSLQDLLSGKVKIGYNANDKEQRKTVNEIIRVAQLGHYNESKSAATMAERNRALDQYNSMKSEHDTWGNDRKIWDAALTAFANGNIEPMKQLAQAYANELSKLPARAPDGYVKESDIREQQATAEAGRQFIETYIVPETQKLANEYGASLKEIQAAVEWHIRQERPELLSREKIDAILKYEIPRLLEDNGYTKGQKPAAQPAKDKSEARIAELEAKLNKVLAGKAKDTNETTERIREKRRKAPPAGGGQPGGSGDSIPSKALESRSSAREWLRS